MDHGDGDHHDGQLNGDGDRHETMGHTVSLYCVHAVFIRSTFTCHNCVVLCMP